MARTLALARLHRSGTGGGGGLVLVWVRGMDGSGVLLVLGNFGLLHNGTRMGFFVLSTYENEEWMEPLQVSCGQRVVARLPCCVDLLSSPPHDRWARGDCIFYFFGVVYPPRRPSL